MLCSACFWIVMFACEHTQSLVQHSLLHVQGAELLNLACIPKKKAGPWFARILAGRLSPGLLHKGRWWSATDTRGSACVWLWSPKLSYFKPDVCCTVTQGTPPFDFRVKGVLVSVCDRSMLYVMGAGLWSISGGYFLVNVITACVLSREVETSASGWFSEKRL